MKFFLVDDKDASSGIFNTIAADDLVTKVTRASAAMVFS